MIVVSTIRLTNSSLWVGVMMDFSKFDTKPRFFSMNWRASTCLFNYVGLSAIRSMSIQITMWIPLCLRNAITGFIEFCEDP